MADLNTGTSYTYSTCSCVHRLPCGYCPLLNRVCPMQGVTYDSPYTVNPCINTEKYEVTCEVKK